MKIIYPKTKSNELTYKELKDLIKSLIKTNINDSLKIKLEKYKKNHIGADDNEVVIYL